MDFDRRKALILPMNSKGEYFIQDRRGFKKPDWGYFGGEIEEGETPLEAVIRETEEELSIKLVENDLVYLGTLETDWDGVKIIRYFHLYRTDQEEFDVQEGAGGYWLSFGEVLERLDKKDHFKDVVDRINKLK